MVRVGMFGMGEETTEEQILKIIEDIEENSSASEEDEYENEEENEEPSISGILKATDVTLTNGSWETLINANSNEMSNMRERLFNLEQRVKELEKGEELELKMTKDCLSCHHSDYCRSDEAYARTCTNNNFFLYYEAHTKNEPSKANSILRKRMLRPENAN